MSDVHRTAQDDHAAIKAELKRYSEIYSVEVWIRGANFWETLNDPAWYIDDTYRLLDRGGRERFRSIGTEGDNPSPATPQSDLTPTDLLDGCCKAAVALLMKPDRSIAEVRKAKAWLMLGIDGADK